MHYAVRSWNDDFPRSLNGAEAEHSGEDSPISLAEVAEEVKKLLTDRLFAVYLVSRWEKLASKAVRQLFARKPIELSAKKTKTSVRNF